MLDDEEEPEKFHSVVIFMDNFHHFRPNDKEEAEGELSDTDESAPKIVQLYSETDDEKPDGEEGKEEEKEEEEQVRPENYFCKNMEVCMGFENPIENEECVVCG